MDNEFTLPLFKMIENSSLSYYTAEGLQELQKLLNLLTQKLSKSFKKIADLSFNLKFLEYRN